MKIRSAVLMATLLVLAACKGGGKDDASDSGSSTPSAPASTATKLDSSATATGALMVPTGSDPECQGPRLIVVYAHGTAVDQTYNIALLKNPSACEGLLLATG